MAERTRFVAQIGDDQRDLPEPGRRRGNRLRRGLDTHRDIGDTSHVYLLVENRFVLSLQGGTFLGWFATAYISLRNSWALRLPKVTAWRNFRRNCRLVRSKREVVRIHSRVTDGSE